MFTIYARNLRSYSSSNKDFFFLVVWISLSNYDTTRLDVNISESGFRKSGHLPFSQRFRILRLWLNFGQHKRFLPKRSLCMQKICVQCYDYGLISANIKGLCQNVHNICAKSACLHFIFIFRLFGFLCQIMTQRE